MQLGLFGSHSRAECRAIASGAQALGWSVVWQRVEVWTPDQAQDFDAVATFGLRYRSGEVRDFYAARGVPCIVIDLPALRIADHFALWPGEVNALPRSGDASRLERVEFKSVPLGEGVLICGQVGGDRAHELSKGEMKAWAAMTFQNVRARCISKRIVWRPHPHQKFYVAGCESENPESRSFEGALCSREFGAVVTFNSTCGVTALRHGVPVHCDESSFYRCLAQKTPYPSDRKPSLPSSTRRNRFFARLMSSQWTLKEIAGGDPIGATLNRFPKELALGAHG